MDNNQKAPEKRAQPVIEGSAQRKRRIGGDFIESDVRSVTSYVLNDIIKPAAKHMIYDAFCNGLGMFLGENFKGSVQGRPANQLPYYNYSDRRTTASNQYNYRTAGSNEGYRYDDIIFGNRGEAEEVLMAMRDMSNQTGYVSVGDLCDMARVKNNYTDYKYGWTDLSDARVDRIGSGYIIRLSRPVYL